jgi:hypothetical protein
MNLYIVVEGAVEKKIYSQWIPLVNPMLVEVRDISLLVQNNFLIVEGGGMPQYFEVIKDAAHDVSINPHIDRLVVSVDSEEDTYHNKRSEIGNFIDALGLPIDYRIVVQHFCFESWALGNKAITSRNPVNERLREYKQHFDVMTSDPELISPPPGNDLNRAKFSESYLRLLLQEKFRNLTYTKRNPGAVAHPKYFDQLVDRLKTTGHIQSFDDFLTAFV